MKFDDILTEIGEFGRYPCYQRRAYFLMCLVLIPTAMQSLGVVFMAGDSDHWCVVPELENEDCSRWPEITPELCEDAKKDASIPPQPKDNQPYEYDNCLRYNLTGVPFYPGVDTSDYTNDTMSCNDGWVYDTSQFQSTVITEFDLVCKKSILPDLSQSIYYVGMLVGSLVFPPLSDIIGRYYSYFISIGLIFASGMAVAFSPNFMAYTIFRFLVAVGDISIYVNAFILETEFVGPSKRMLAGTGLNFVFAIGCMLLALLAFFIRDWWILGIVISAPRFSYSYLYQSPRWLMSKGRFDEAEKIIREVARVNNAKLPEPLFDEEEKRKIAEANKEHRATALDLFRTPTLRWRPFILMFIWIVNTLVYYGLSLSTSSLGSDPYVAFFLSGLVEVPANLWALIGIEWLGRKRNLMALLVLGGVACLAAIGTPPGAAKTTVAMLGKFCISASFTVVYIYTAEIYPTIVRGAGFGVCSVSARIGGIISPLILLIGDYWFPLPFVIFGSSSIIAGFLVLLLPESKGQKLPETLEEGENFGKNSRTRCDDTMVLSNPADADKDVNEGDKIPGI